jgi:hypothetical protein
MTDTSPPVTAPRNRDLVMHLELLLEQARKGELQLLIVSAARLPFSPEGWGSLLVEGYAAFGPIARRFDETSLRATYAKTLEGVAGAAATADADFNELLKRFAEEPTAP